MVSKGRAANCRARGPRRGILSPRRPARNPAGARGCPPRATGKEKGPPAQRAGAPANRPPCARRGGLLLAPALVGAAALVFAGLQGSGRYADAKAAYERAISLGAWGYANQAGPGELNIPAIKGIGDSIIYFIDRWRGKNGAQEGDIGNIGFFDVDFEPLAGAELNPVGHGLTYIDHLTHNVHRGRMKEWADFYERLFNFREIRYFDIEGQATGVKSKAMTSPCGKIRIPINEEGNEKAGQIQEYLDMYHGEGIQHIALGSTNLYDTVDALQMNGVKLLTTSETYYELLPKRIPGLQEDIAGLQQRNILVDGLPGELLLQIFSENQLGPIFFEFIQRKGNEGFGEGNFKALFESIELDQMRRGVI